MDNRHVKGRSIKLVFDFIEKSYSPAERDEIMAMIDPAVVALIPKLNVANWYPLDYQVSIYDALFKHGGEEPLRRCARFVAEDALTTFLKLLLKLLTPKLFASKFDSFWQKYHDFGKFTCDIKEIESNHIILYCPAYPWMHIMGAEWAEVTFKAMGKTSVVATTGVPPGQRLVSGDTVECHVRW